jgi:ribose/xylose/arabinose/galactoside ABC-type transport system permease subunit
LHFLASFRSSDTRPAESAVATPDGWRIRLASILPTELTSAAFVPVWIATGLLLLVAAIIAPETLSSNSWSAILTLMTFLATAALGEMLVIMSGGIDLAISGVITSSLVSFACSIREHPRVAAHRR